MNSLNIINQIRQTFNQPLEYVISHMGDINILIDNIESSYVQDISNTVVEIEQSILTSPAIENIRKDPNNVAVLNTVVKQLQTRTEPFNSDELVIDLPLINGISYDLSLSSLDNLRNYLSDWDVDMTMDDDIRTNKRYIRNIVNEISLLETEMANTINTIQSMKMMLLNEVIHYITSSLYQVLELHAKKVHMIKSKQLITDYMFMVRFNGVNGFVLPQRQTDSVNEFIKCVVKQYVGLSN